MENSTYSNIYIGIMELHIYKGKRVLVNYNNMAVYITSPISILYIMLIIIYFQIIALLVSIRRYAPVSVGNFHGSYSTEKII